MKPHIFYRGGEWRIARCGLRTFRRLAAQGFTFLGEPMNRPRRVR